MLVKSHDIAAILIGTIAITLNLLVLRSLYQVKVHLTTHHHLIINLAVYDVVFAIELEVLNYIMRDLFQNVHY